MESGIRVTPRTRKDAAHGQDRHLPGDYRTGRSHGVGHRIHMRGKENNITPRYAARNNLPAGNDIRTSAQLFRRPVFPAPVGR